MMLHYASLKYADWQNIGDHIQSLAVEQFLPRINVRFERDNLRNISKRKKKYIIVANGWFSHTPEQCFPFAPFFVPLFFGFHITDWNNSWEYVKNEHVLDFFKKHSPIGCRDRYTANKLHELGLDTYFSNCMTLSFPKRDCVPPKTNYVLVDVPHNLKIPDYVVKNSQFITHQSENIPQKDIFSVARLLLDYYRKKASAVITTRLHCALPCLAMGIPVIFIGNEKDYRISNLSEVRVKIYNINELSNISRWDELFFYDFDFIESYKNSMIINFKEQLNRVENM